MSKKAIDKKKAPKKARAAKPVPAANMTPAVPGTPDPRLPPPGTLLKKLDRHGAVRCECTVEEGGFRYAGELYRSLSAAAMAAAKDLGLNNRTQNGFAFFGITKPSRRPSDPLAALDRIWERYQANVEALVKGGVTDENRSQVVAAISKHAQVIEGLRGKMA
jgi:hypothetical protein